MASPGGTPRARRAAEGAGAGAGAPSGGGGGFSGMFDASGGAAGASTRDLAHGFLAAYGAGGARLGGAPGTALPGGVGGGALGASLPRPAALGAATPPRSAAGNGGGGSGGGGGAYGAGGGGGQALPGRAPADAGAFAAALSGLGNLSTSDRVRDSPAAGQPTSLGMLAGRGPRPQAPGAGR